MNLSVSMIVKNESSCLRKALESVKDADEIVIVDTGSTDNTIEIAKEYTDKVYSGEEYKWRDDFAFSRNQSLEKCTGDWVLIIDADEYLEVNGIQKVRELITTLKTKAVHFKTISDSDHDMIHTSIRLFKNNEGIVWKAKVHNYLSTQDVTESDIKLYFAYSEAHKQDEDRSLRILSKVVAEDQECIREKFYLAREYLSRGSFSIASAIYKAYLEKAYYGSEIADAWLMLARCSAGLNKNDEARDFCLQAIKINANFKEAWVMLANLSGPKNKEVFLRMAELANNEDVLFLR